MKKWPKKTICIKHSSFGSTLRHLATPAGVSRRHRLKYATALSVILTGAVALPKIGNAYEFNTGLPDLTASWTNTVTYSNAFRVNNPSPTLDGSNGDPNSYNHNDGNNNFKAGLVSNRATVFSDFKFGYQNFGGELSGDGFYDSIYNQANDNTGAYYPNSNRGYNQFPEKTQYLDGRRIQLLDANLYGDFDLGGHQTTLRVGNQTVEWGESLFLGQNGIAGAMAPVDVDVLLTQPNASFKQAILPVPQIYGNFEITPDISVSAYYQFNYTPSRLPSAGSYFSVSEEGGDGSGFAYGTVNGSNYAISRLPDQKPNGAGQFGVAAHFSVGNAYCGVYLVHFDDKSFLLVPSIGLISPSRPGPPLGVGVTGYRDVYPTDIWLQGASFSESFNDTNVGAEVSIREHQDFDSTNDADISALTGGAANNNTNNPSYAIGDALNGNLNIIQTLQPSRLWPEAGLLAEVAVNQVLAVTQNKSALDTTATKFAATFQAAFTPTYPQALPNFNLSVPMGISFTPGGSRSEEFGPAFPASGGGQMNIGLSGIYKNTWTVSLGYNHYYGPASFVELANARGAQIGWGQTLKDRDNVQFSIARTF